LLRYALRVATYVAGISGLARRYRNRLLEDNLPIRLTPEEKPRYLARHFVGSVGLQSDDLRIGQIRADYFRRQTRRRTPARRVTDVTVEANVDAFRPPVRVDGAVE